MKRFPAVHLLLIAAAYIAVTGFQCGSAELTTARLAMQQKQWQKAEESFLKELQKNENNEEAWFLLGQVRLELKKYPEMNEAYGRALAISGIHASDIARTRIAIWAELYNQGINEYNRGREDSTAYAVAINAFTIAIALNPDSASTYYVTALAYYAKNDLNKAETLLKTAMEKKPVYVDAARLQGRIHMLRAQQKKDAKDGPGATAEYTKAAAALEMVYKAEPANADNIAMLIEAYELANEVDKAMTLTRDAVASDPKNPIFRFAYGVFLLKRDKFEESIEQFTKALEIQPENPDAIYNLGVAYLNWGVAMKEADTKRGESMKAKVYKPDLSYKEKFRASLPYLEKITKLRPDDTALWLQLGKVYVNLNMQKESKAAFDQADRVTGEK